MTTLRTLKFLILGLMFLLFSCKGLKRTDKICFAVRDKSSKLINKSVLYELRSGDRVISKGATNEFGFFILKRKEIQKQDPLESQLMVIDPGGKKASIPLSSYSNIFDIYLDPPDRVDSSKRIADMHYHVSMRSHNLWAQEFYEPGKLTPKKEIPDNMNWFKWYNKLCVYDGHKWAKVKLKTGGTKSEKEKMKILLDGDWVKPKEGANNLKHFSEATFPHTREGNVFIGYNAISPFEYSVSDVGIKRALSSAFKTGLNIQWLKIMGGKKGHFSHWENFKREYEMITTQRQNINNFQWTYLKLGEELDKHLQHPVIINVVEGGHILQDKYFPHFIDYNLTDSTSSITWDERKEIFDRIKKDPQNPRHQDFLDIKTQKEITREKGTSQSEKREKIDTSRRAMWQSVDDALLNELYSNIDILKTMNIYMMAIGHLSYNGMVGHAPALDVSKKPLLENLISGFLRRAYGTRVSNDRRYRKAFDGTFYRVPGVNYFGDSVITRLLDRSLSGRIQIDLKHSDPITRKEILKKYAALSNLADTTADDDKLRPICSHCAVNGLPIDYSSPVVNEYQLLKADVVQKFYPFGMNLYNDEVRQIVEQNGIIGIPLEERVLGGYINAKIQWPHCIKKSKSGKYIEEKNNIEITKRFDYLKKVLHYLEQKDTILEMVAVNAFYKSKLLMAGINNDTTTLLDLICSDYLSAEPFLQNLFHVVDIAFTTTENNKMDSIYNTRDISENMKSEIAGLQSQSRTPKVQAEISKVLKDSLYVIRVNSWNNVCIGSDLDGLIDPLNICPTATNYPLFKEKLTAFIPLFLLIRNTYEPYDPFLGHHRTFKDYFGSPDSEFGVEEALNKVFYLNLEAFTRYIVEQRKAKP